MLKAALCAGVLAAIVFVVAFLAIWTWGDSFRSPRQEQQQHQNQPSSPNGKADQKMSPDGNQEGNRWSRIKKKAQEYRDHFIEHVERRDKVYVALSGIAVAAFTLALFVATFLLWFAGERHSERQLRAYMGNFASDMNLYNLDGGEAVFIAHTEIRNFGQTPAYKVTGWADTKIDVPTATPFANEPQTPIVSAGIGFPGAGIHIRRYQPVSHVEADEIRHKKKTVFFWGRVDYTDAFGHSRYFKFRLINTELVIGTTGLFGLGTHDLGHDAN